jgi:DNA-directed RNA polymerase subunit H (RpoH/RPB5)
MEATNIDTIIENVTDMLIIRGDDISEFSEHTYLTPSHMFKTHQLIFHTNRTAVIFIPRATITGTVKSSMFKDFKDAKENRDPEQIISVLSQSEDPDHVERNVSSVIFVFDEDPQSHNRKIIADADKVLQTVGGIAQYFTYNDLMYNPTKHIYVPLHEKLDESNIKSLFETYQLKSKSQLPVILRTDIIARWLGLKHGDIVKITRNNPSSGVYYFYRCCV